MRRDDSRVGAFLVYSATNRVGMRLQESKRIDWDTITSLSIPEAIKREVLAKVQDEINFHERGFDAELFFAAYLAIDISRGCFGATEAEIDEANELLERMEDRYPGSIEELREGGREAIGGVAVAREPEPEDDEDFDDSI